MQTYTVTVKEEVSFKDKFPNVNLIEDPQLEEVDYPAYEADLDKVSMYVKIMAKYIENQYREKYKHIKKIYLIGTGSSGMFFSTLIMQRLMRLYIMDEVEVRVYYISKGENRHGEHHPVSSNSFNVIVDDFICNGDTVENIFDKFPGTIHGLIVTGTVCNINRISFWEKISSLDFFVCKKVRQKWIR